MDYKKLLGENFIPVRGSIVKLLGGDGNAAILLSYFMFRSDSDEANANKGWFTASGTKIQNRTGLSRVAQTRIRTLLMSLGYIEESKDAKMNRVLYRVNYSILGEAVVSPTVSPALQPVVSPALQTPVTPPLQPLEEGEESLEENIYSASVPSRRNASINVLDSGIYRTGKDSDWFITGIYDTYPQNKAGISPSKELIARMVARLAKVPYNADDARRQQACQALDDFRAATKNFAKAVDLGLYNRDYVWSFEAFSGINRKHDYVPKYKDWIAWQPPVKKRELVAV